MKVAASLVLGQADHMDSIEAASSRGASFHRYFGGAKWKGGLSASGAGVAIDHSATRQNARMAMQDSVLCRAMVERLADTVAGGKLILEMTPDHAVLGITPEEARDWGAKVAARFNLYAEDKKQHRSETMTFYQATRFYAFSQQRENDVFVRLYYDRSPNLQNPLQFEFLDPDQIRGDATTYSDGFNLQDDGIVRDARGRETAYKIWNVNPDGTYRETQVAARKGGRFQMLHGFRQEYAGQGRGFARLAHAIQEFENITDFSSATIKKAINQSQIVAFVEPSDEEDAVNPLEGILTDAGAGPAQDTPSAAVPSVADGDPMYSSMTDCYEVPEATMGQPGGMFIANLTKGSTLKPFQNTSPAESFDSFVNSFAGYISAATSTPLEVVLMKFGQNYSASRATLLLFWRVANGWRDEEDADFLGPFIEMWMSEEIAAGRLAAPGWSDPVLRAAWLKHNWVGDAAPDIDPSKTANASKINLEIGRTNVEREARNLNGSSAAANIEMNNELFARQTVAPWHSNAAVGDAGNGESNDD